MSKYPCHYASIYHLSENLNRTDITEARCIQVKRLFGPEDVFAPDLSVRTEHPLSVSIYHARGGDGTRPLPAPEITEWKRGDTVEANGWCMHTASVPRHSVRPAYLHGAFGTRGTWQGGKRGESSY